MIWGWDADGHVYESEVTFSDKYFDPKYRDRRPLVVRAEETGMHWFAIDDRLFPRRFGAFIQNGGVPSSKNGVPTPSMLLKKSDPWQSSEMRSAKDRLDQMDREHIAVQVNYPTMFLSYPLTQDPGLGSAMARAYNSWMADISSQAPDRLKWVTVIDPGDPVEAAKEIYRSKDLGSVGVMLLGMADNVHIDDASMEPIWAAANETGLPVALHVGFCCSALGNLYTDTIDTLVVPFGFTLLMGFQRVMASGLLDKYPNLRVAFLEAGCSWVEFVAERITEYSSKPGTRLTNPRAAAVNRQNPNYRSQGLPRDYIKAGRLFFGCEPDEESLPHFLGEFGADCLLFASDIPHFDRLVGAIDIFQERKDINERAKRKILVENVARFYGIPENVKVPAAGAG
jgi:predicted TIM-barrel fold metal-dependent hydrolase